MRNSQIIGICLVVSAVILSVAIVYQGKSGTVTSSMGSFQRARWRSSTLRLATSRWFRWRQEPECPAFDSASCGFRVLPPGGMTPDLGAMGAKGASKAAPERGESKKEPPKVSK